MNIVKLLSPDFFTGRVLVAIKAICDNTAMVAQSPSQQSILLARNILKVKPSYTMVTSKNLANLYSLVQQLNRMDIQGDIVECGVWNGGSAAIMGLACLDGDKAKTRNMWLFDSFSGLPRPGAKDGELEKKAFFEGWNKGEIEKVKQAFRKLGVPIDHVRIIPGWFEETLKTVSLRRVSLLHIDADWYNSVKVALETLYDKVVPGGFVVLDDYGYWEGCKKALDDYIAENGLRNISLKRVDRIGAYFQKPQLT
ncbi:MAG: TylF/MycF/NovP-related O-methyltransferase [Candidatus Binatia bacterium]